MVRWPDNRVQRGWASALTIVTSLSVAMGLLEWLSRVLAPPPTEDPRLGPLMFWIWVAVVAGVTYALSTYMDDAAPLELVSWGLWVLGWLAWKLGLNDSWEDTPREREEIWATTVGVILALV